MVLKVKTSNLQLILTNLNQEEETLDSKEMAMALVTSNQRYKGTDRLNHK